MKMKAKRFLSIVLCMMLTLLPLTALAAGGEIPAQTDKPGFSDLEATDVLYPYTRYLKCQGIISGLPDGTFHPEAALTRAEAASIAVLAKKIPLVSGGNPTFNDVAAGHWAYSYIETAAQAGLMSGFPGGAFGPDKPITRAEAASWLLKLSGGGLSEEILSIADVAADSWAYRQAVTAVKAGLMGLSSNGLFAPDAAFTRGELAQSLTALLTLGPDLSKAELVGKLTVKTGTVKLTGQDGSSRLLAEDQETTVTAGMTIATATGSRAEISYDDGSGIRVEPATQISVVKSDGFKYMRPDGTPAVAVDRLEIKMSGGQIFGALANRSEGATENYIKPADESTLSWWVYPYAARERIRVNSPSSVTGVWGSFWSQLVTSPGSGSSAVLEGGASPPGGGETSVLSGHVEVSAGGQAVSLGGGQGTTVPPVSLSGEGMAPPAPPTPPAPLTPQQAQTFSSASGRILNCAQAIQTNAPAPPPPPQQPGGGPTAPGQTAGGQTPPPSITPGPQQQQGNVVGVIQEALGQAGSIQPPQTTTGGSSGSEGPAGDTLPTITEGSDTINLTEGYEDYNLSYIFGGDPAPTEYGISSNHPNTARDLFGDHADHPGWGCRPYRGGFALYRYALRYQFGRYNEPNDYRKCEPGGDH
ncbi:MAG: S-layer homology domain-containing protein [Syntrophomonadaceae bacterium]|nr:S-layer homology domain-containing protein [Syntrophomonadaceae bacterium]